MRRLGEMDIFLAVAPNLWDGKCIFVSIANERVTYVIGRNYEGNTSF